MEINRHGPYWMNDNGTLKTVLQRIDDANAADPRREEYAGESWPKEQLYGRRMHEWVLRLAPDASEVLQIAARGQHLRRWEIPRSDYPMDRAGYHQWRTTLYAFHGDRVGEIMAEAGYGPEPIERVKFILQKKKLKTDPEVQTLEDAAALVFLENHFVEFWDRADIDEAKMIGILRKTWAKMSERAHAAALELDYTPEAEVLIRRALGAGE